VVIGPNTPALKKTMVLVIKEHGSASRLCGAGQLAKRGLVDLTANDDDDSIDRSDGDRHQ